MEHFDTNTLDTFTFYDSNRDSKTSRPLLEESIRDNGQTKSILCIRDKKGRIIIIDGQHTARLLARLGLKIHYTVVPVKQKTGETFREAVLRLIIQHNTNAMNWKPLDFVKAFSTFGYDDYTQLLDKAEKYGYSVTAMSDIFMKGSKSEVSYAVKHGTFKMNASTYGTTIMNYVMEYKQIVRFPMRALRGFAIFYNKCNGQFDHQAFKAALRQKRDEFRKLAETTQYSEFFQSLL